MMHAKSLNQMLILFLLFITIPARSAEQTALSVLPSLPFPLIAAAGAAGTLYALHLHSQACNKLDIAHLLSTNPKFDYLRTIDIPLSWKQRIFQDVQITHIYSIDYIGSPLNGDLSINYLCQDASYTPVNSQNKAISPNGDLMAAIAKKAPSLFSSDNWKRKNGTAIHLFRRKKIDE